MQINWKVKSRIFGLIDFLHADSLLYFLQRNVTRRSRVTTLTVSDTWSAHRKALIDNRCTSFVFEFGAGKNLAQNLFLSSFVDKQLVVDLNPMLDLRQVNRSRLLLSNLNSDTPIMQPQDLLAYGIEYRAPYDASQLDLADNTLDACVTTNTLEHIPTDSIHDIFTELWRVLKDSGIVSAKIDYSDHYSHSDASITALNFLRFSDPQWRQHNHRCHFQNRLRHNDYRLLFLEVGFEIVSEDLTFGAKAVPQDLWEKVDTSSPTWSATSGHFVLRKKVS